MDFSEDVSFWKDKKIGFLSTVEKSKKEKLDFYGL